MRVTGGLGAIALGPAITVTGCASPPNADVEAAKASLDAAVSDHADQHAAESGMRPSGRGTGPCHGSRFTPNGDVIAGPARVPLSTIE